MRSVRCLFASPSLLCIVSTLISVSAASIPLGAGGASRKIIFTRRPYAPAFEKYAHKIYDNADSDHDGSVSLSECYELVLRMYIKINQKASIPPPSRENVLRIFKESDRNNNRRISREEFIDLAAILCRRATLAVMAHSLVTYLVAPMVAEYMVRTYAEKRWLVQLANNVVPSKWLPMVSTRAFGRTILTAIFVSTLGNCVLDTFFWWLDWWNYKPKEA